LSETNLAYNALDTFNANIRQCLKQIDPDWQMTQTVAPRHAAITAISTDTIDLTWTPIFYTADGGGYEISYSTEFSGVYTVHGQTTDKNATGYQLDGLPGGTTIYVRVRTVTPAHAGNADELRSEAIRQMGVTASDETLLLILYMAFDNDLSSYALDITQRVQFGTTLNPNIEVVMLVDRRGDENTDVLTVADGTVTRTNTVFEHWGSHELDTADPDVLSWFLQHARATYPASRTLVSLIGHGVGPSPEVIIDEPAQSRVKAPPLPQGQDFTPGDITSLTYMSTVELGRALNEATDDGANPFDLIFFDQCFQGNLDVLYEIRNAAQIVVASPNYAWLSAPYARYVSQLAPAASPEEIANDIIRIYEDSLNQYHPNAIFWLHSSDIAAIGDALSTLGDALRQATIGGQEAKIMAATLASRFADTTQCAERLYDLAPPDELIGIGRFALNLQQAFPAGDPAGVHAAAAELFDRVTVIQRNYRVGNPYIAPDQIWNYDDAMSILAPLRRELPGNIAWRASIYTQTAPITAGWAAVPTQTLTIPSALAYARDGRWDDFIAMWYTNLGSPIVGQWCNYTPPARVIAEDAETLSLTAAVSDIASVQLQWTATSKEDAEAYWLFGRTPTDLDWVLQTTLPLTQTTYLAALSPGDTYNYIVFASDSDNTFVATSNEVTGTVAGGPQKVYLPILTR
jgi:hypothetical protein